MKAELPAQGAGARRGRGRGCASSRCRCRTRPTVACPTAAKTTASCSSTVGDDAARARARPRRVRRGDGLRRHRARAPKRAGRASRTSCARRRCSSSRSCNYAMQRLVAHGFAPVVTPTLVRERTMEEAGLLPDRPRAGVRRRRRRAVPRRHERGAALGAAPRRHARRPTSCPRATRATRRASGARPARTARTRAASSACTSSTRSRCSRSASPSESWDEHERILAIEEQIIGGLGLPYRVVNIAAGDLGPAAAKKYDIEAWLPSEGRTASSRRARTTPTTPRAGSARA